MFRLVESSSLHMCNKALWPKLSLNYVRDRDEIVQHKCFFNISLPRLLQLVSLFQNRDYLFNIVAMRLKGVVIALKVNSRSMVFTGFIGFAERSCIRTEPMASGEEFFNSVFP